jgi:tyrosinase
MMAHAVGLEAPKALEKAAAQATAKATAAPVTASASSVEAAEAAAPTPTPESAPASVAAPKALATHVKSEHTHTPAPTASSSAPHPIDESKVSREWYVDDVVARLALNTSFTILYFIGSFTPSDSLVGLMMAPTFAGLNHVFAAPIEACDNCEQQEGVAHMVRSTSPITSMLLDYVGTGELGSMRPEHVRGFLVKNLKWRVVTVC